MIDLVFVARTLPRPADLFWPALVASGLTTRPCPPGERARLAEEGIELVLLPIERIAREEIDREAAAERARASLAESVEQLERRVARLHARIVAFLGTSLHAAALGPRIVGDGGDSDALRDARFGGAVAVAIPHISRLSPPAVFLERMRELARLRAELSQRDRGAGAP